MSSYAYPSTDIIAQAEKTDATKAAKVAVIKATSNFEDDIYLSKAEIDLVVEDCYNDIAARKTDGNYIAAVIEGVAMYVYSKGNKKEDVKEGAEQLLALASRTIKGEGCSECDSTYHCSGCGVSPSIHRLFVNQILEMLYEPTLQPLSLDIRAQFSLDKLCIIFGTIYRPLRSHVEAKINAMDMDLRSELESMWCHLPGDPQEEFGERTCECWDSSGASSYQQHWKGCRFWDL